MQRWFVWCQPRDRIVRDNLTRDEAIRIANRMNDIAGFPHFVPDARVINTCQGSCPCPTPCEISDQID